MNLLLQELHQKPNNKNCLPKQKILESPLFLKLFTEGKFDLFKFTHFLDNEGCDEAACGCKRLYKLKLILYMMRFIQSCG